VTTSDIETSTETRVPIIDNVSIGYLAGTKPTDEDPFLAKAGELRTLDGLDVNLKRRLTRMEKAYTGQGDAKSTAVETGYFSAYDAFNVVVPPYNLDYLSTIYTINSANFAACNAKTANIVGLGYSWTETAATLDKIDSAKNPDEIDKLRKKLGRFKMQLDNTLDALNYEDTFIEVLQKVWTDYEATGNGYIEVGRKKDGTIGYVGHVNANTMRIRRARDGYVQIVGKEITFFRNFGDQKTKDQVTNTPSSQLNEVIHIKKYNPTNTFYGVPDIVSAATAVAGDEFAARFNLDYFEHKAVPRYVITIKGAELGPEAEKQLHEFFMSNLKGKNHRTLYIPLPADSATSKVEFEMKPVEAGVQDSSFNQYRATNRDEIFMAHRTPPIKTGLSGNLNLAAARDADKTFKEQVCRPEQDRLEKRVNLIIGELTNVFKFKLNELSLTDEDTQSQIDERNARNQIRTINEIRAGQGLPPHPDGDKFLELKPQQVADAQNNANGNDARGRSRSNNSPDSSSSSGRATQGDGRSTQ
jgi:PBSX family phage portal protein